MILRIITAQVLVDFVSVRRINLDIVEFAEKICDFTLTDWHKEFLRKAYEAIKNNGKLYYIPPRGSSRFSLTTLQALSVIFAAHERGLLKDKEE